PPGNYLVNVDFSTSRGAANNITQYGLYDGTSYISSVAHAGDSTNDLDAVSMTGIVSHTGGPLTLALHCATASSSTCHIENSNNNRKTAFKVIRFPSSSTRVVTLETQGWFVNATIGGANVSIGTSDVSTYSELANGSLA